MKKLGILVLAALLLGAVGAAACSNDPSPAYCTGIPAGGCPGGGQYLDAATNCADPTCRAIYSTGDDCSWTLVAMCPAAATKDGSSDSAPLDAAVDAFRLHDGAVHDAGFVIPPGANGEGCEAGLEEPDCPLDEAIVCGTNCCGCDALWVCQDGGWSYWGACNEAGAIEPATQ